MRTDKWFRLSRLAYYLSKRTGYNYNLFPIDTSPVWTTGWLAGFIDADGSFGVNINFFANTGYPRITTVFAISQALFTSLGTPNLSVMQSIAYFLGVKLKISRRNQFLVRAGGANSLTLLAGYFHQFPLMSSKRLDYQDFMRVHNMAISGQTREQLGDMQAIKAGINSKRTVFNWYHLNN